MKTQPPLTAADKDKPRIEACPAPDIGFETTFSTIEVEQQLKNVLASPDFSATRQQRAFLEFIISQTLAGNSQGIKGYTVATQVFGRDENFDQAIDPIVSIQANKLRRALERYYFLSGKDDAIRIDIPKGSYIPVFVKKAQKEKIPESRGDNKLDMSPERTWPTILIKPFQNLTNDPAKEYWGTGFAAELSTEINRFRGVNVLYFGADGKGRRNSDLGARFLVEGSFRGEGNTYKILVNLIDLTTNTLIWSDTQLFDGDIAKILFFQEKIALAIGTKMAGEQGVISRTLYAESKNKHPDQLSTYEAILRFHQFDRTLSSDDFLIAFEALEKAKVNEPDCGQVWSFLARLYANIFSLEILDFDPDHYQKKALQHAEKGAWLNPDSQGAIGTLAYVRLLSGDIHAARRDIKRAHEMQPNSLYLMDGIGYVQALLGNWKFGTELIRKAISLNPYYKPVVHYALWVDCLRQHEFENAYVETCGLRRPEVFWYPLVKASTLGLLGRIEEGRRYADDLLKMKPNFKERGRTLIGRYIKFREITALVIQGLAEVGIFVD